MRSLKSRQQGGLCKFQQFLSGKHTLEFSPDWYSRQSVMMPRMDQGMHYRWRCAQPTAAQQAAAGDLSRQLGVHRAVAQLMVGRGLANKDEAKAFFEPKLSELHDPVAMPGLLRAAERLSKAVEDGQPIVIFGDYDVDGISASAILWHMIKHAGGEVTTYIPHRVDEGYGLNKDAIAELVGQTPQPVIVSVDCGITAGGPAAVAAEAGADLIITDHHHFDADDLPGAYALVHPRLPGSTYPYGELCGAGVAFKLAWQFAKIHTGSERVPESFRELLLDLLAVAALGTVADVVPLVDENRIITRFGLNQMKRTRFAGLNALIDRTGLRSKELEAFHIGFVLGPRLNACGRMGKAMDALRLFTTENDTEANELAIQMDDANADRRETEKRIVDEAIAIVEKEGYDSDDKRAIVMGAEGWHPGVIGIVASRIVDRFHRPAVLLNFDDGEAHGSARSIDGFSIHDALSHCQKHLTSFGGHAMAAGLRLNRKSVDALRDDLIAFANESLSVADLVPVLKVDVECAMKEVTLSLVDQLKQLAPFGRGNPGPLFCLRNAQVADTRRLGNAGQHLRINLRGDGIVLQGIAWRKGDLAPQLPGGVRVDVVFEAKENDWGGNRRVDLQIKDLRIV